MRAARRSEFMPTRHRSAQFLASIAALGAVALAVTGCKTTGAPETTGSIASPAPPRTDAEWRQESEAWGARYRANPGDKEAALRYAQALRALDQLKQASSVLEQASYRHPNDKAVLGAYGRALAEIGHFEQALDVLGRAHTPDQPDWRILSVQGAVLDQLGRHQDAQRYYATALKIVPEEPSVLSNLGLSYALAKDLPNAETTLRRAAKRGSSDPRVRQNLALVIGLQGRFAEAESIVAADLPPEEAAANVAYLKQMLSQPNDWKKIARSPGSARGKLAAQ
jgi:Flp pilus assembly protein TadD